MAAKGLRYHKELRVEKIRKERAHLWPVVRQCFANIFICVSCGLDFSLTQRIRFGGTFPNTLNMFVKSTENFLQVFEKNSAQNNEVLSEYFNSILGLISSSFF